MNSMFQSSNALISRKGLHLLLVLTSMIVYLEWGGGNQSFLVEAEKELFIKLLSDPLSVMHPFTVLPLVGQFLLMASLFMKNPPKWLSWLGMGCIGILVFFILFVGLLSGSIKIIGSTIPFMLILTITIRQLRMMKSIPAN